MKQKRKHLVKREKSKLINRLRRIYKLVLMDEESFEEKISLRINRLGVIIMSSSIIIVLILSTIFIIAFTPLRKYIPGYSDVTLPKKIYQLQQKVDSLEKVALIADNYMMNLKRVIQGEEVESPLIPVTTKPLKTDLIKDSPSKAEMDMRLEYQTLSQYNLYQNRSNPVKPTSPGDMNFFPPLSGKITGKFNPSQGQYGVEVSAFRNEAIKAVLDGTIIFSDWTLESGYIVGIQHQNDLISIYKHISSLLKDSGIFVKAGETIAIIGESGEYYGGTSLHFELWYKGNPVDPEKFITF